MKIFFISIIRWERSLLSSWLIHTASTQMGRGQKLERNCRKADSGFGCTKNDSSSRNISFFRYVSPKYTAVRSTREPDPQDSGECQIWWVPNAARLGVQALAGSFWLWDRVFDMWTFSGGRCYWCKEVFFKFRTQMNWNWTTENISWKWVSQREWTSWKSSSLHNVLLTLLRSRHITHCFFTHQLVFVGSSETREIAAYVSEDIFIHHIFSDT